ncbi:uncharacterized protein LOC141617112 [Silene latifolia]|uniref:uncharacterized protein LOC141617112 n=1 Tax=Silene latifolia TaxID=37657 RepID=UPI003D7727D0
METRLVRGLNVRNYGSHQKDLTGKVLITGEAAPGHLPTPGLTDRKSTMLMSNEGIPDIHHDGLVITMQIGIARVLRILVDGGSSVNLTMLDVLKAMKINKDQIIKKSNDLVGFSGETKKTLREIYLPTYVEGISLYERFGVLDCLSSYNAILSKPWIHNVRTIPSTYHQCVKDQVVLDPKYPDRYVLVGSDVIDNIRLELKKRKFAPERNTIINEEVDKLLDMRMIREVMYPKWLANVVMVQKKNGATYQCLVNMMFKDQIGDTMEVYIDDMVVKLKKAENHVKDVKVAFKILEEFNMKLNPSKCHFGVSSGKFLGYMVTKRGIEASLEQIKVILGWNLLIQSKISRN